MNILYCLLVSLAGAGVMFWLHLAWSNRCYTTQWEVTKLFGWVILAFAGLLLMAYGALFLIGNPVS